MTGPDPVRDCKHGRLKRKCEECDMGNEIAALRSSLAAAEARVREVERERDDMREWGRRCQRDRADALNVKSRDGLLSSEWLARTGRAERERDAALARADRLEKALATILFAHSQPTLGPEGPCDCDMCEHCRAALAAQDEKGEP